jgi:hypothetical protein
MPLELSDVLHIATKDGRSLPFGVVGILDDADDGAAYAVLFREDEDDGEFIVTDLEGELLQDAELAQEILDYFLHSARENE